MPKPYTNTFQAFATTVELLDNLLEVTVDVDTVQTVNMMIVVIVIVNRNK